MVSINIYADGLEGALDQFASAVAPEAEDAMDDISDEVLARARSLHRFQSRTGNLVDSVYAEPTVDGVEYGISDSQAHYGKYIHDGTRRWRSDPFLLRAVEYYLSKMAGSVELAIGNLIQRLGL